MKKARKNGIRVDYGTKRVSHFVVIVAENCFISERRFMETCATIYENAIRAFIVISARGFSVRRVLLLFRRFSKKFGFSHDKNFAFVFFSANFLP